MRPRLFFQRWVEYCFITTEPVAFYWARSDKATRHCRAGETAPYCTGSQNAKLHCSIDVQTPRDWRRPVTAPWNRAVKCSHVSRDVSRSSVLARMRTVVLVVLRRRKVNRCPPDLWLSSPHLAAAAAAEKMVGQVRGACRRRVIEHSWRRTLSVRGFLARTFRETSWQPHPIPAVWLVGDQSAKKGMLTPLIRILKQTWYCFNIQQSSLELQQWQAASRGHQIIRGGENCKERFVINAPERLVHI